MKVSSILLTSCLVGLCHCKKSRFVTDRLYIEVRDDYTEDRVVPSYLLGGMDAYNDAVSNGKKLVWDMANGTVYEEGYMPFFTYRRHEDKVKVPEQDDVTTDESLSLDGNAANLTAPEDATATKLADGSKEVWTFSGAQGSNVNMISGLKDLVTFKSTF